MALNPKLGPKLQRRREEEPIPLMRGAMRTAHPPTQRHQGQTPPLKAALHSPRWPVYRNPAQI